MKQRRRDGISDGHNGSHHPGQAEANWVNAEAKRRRVPVAQVVRDSFRAYRKLVKEAAAVPELPKPGIPVDF